MGKATIEPSWKIFKCAVINREAIIDLRRSEPVKTQESAASTEAKFREALKAFSDGPRVKRYRNARAELVKAIKALDDAIVKVAAGEQAVIDAAGEGLESLTAADDQHDAAVSQHAKLQKRVTLLREACQLEWTELQRELQTLSDEIRGIRCREAISEIAEKQAELTKLAGPILDRLAELYAIRTRNQDHPPVDAAIALRLEAPPQPNSFGPVMDLTSVEGQMALRGGQAALRG